MFFDVEVYLRTNGISPTIIGEGDDVDLFKLVTDNEVGFTIVPDVTMAKFKENKSLVILGEVKDLESSVWAIMRKDGPENLKAFMDKIARTKK